LKLDGFGRGEAKKYQLFTIPLFRRKWEPQACPPCWVVAESEAQRVKSDEKKIDYHPI
jgi:hypothetical protein